MHGAIDGINIEVPSPQGGGGDALMVEMDLDGLGEGQEVSLVCCVDAWSKERRGGR